MVGRKAPPVVIGDRFMKTGDLYGRVWTVIRLWTTSDGLPHVRLENDGLDHETRIISLSALVDEHYYVRIQNNSKDG